MHPADNNFIFTATFLALTHAHFPNLVLEYKYRCVGRCRQELHTGTGAGAGTGQEPCTGISVGCRCGVQYWHRCQL